MTFDVRNTAPPGAPPTLADPASLRDRTAGPTKRRPGWLVVLLGCVPFLLYYGGSWARHAQVTRWNTGAPVPSFWGVTPNAWAWGLLGLCGAVLLIVRSRLRPQAQVDILILVLAAGLLIATLMLRATYGIVGGDVMVTPAEPWRPDIRFRLADATVVERGCRTSSRRHGYHSHVIFRIRYPAAEGDGTVDLGSDVDHANIAQWLVAMRRYTDGTLPLPPGSADGVVHDPSCYRTLTRDLDRDQAARLHRLVD